MNRQQDKQTILLCYVYMLCLLFLYGCSTHVQKGSHDIRMGIVPFYQPTELNQIFAGKVFPYSTKASAEEKKTLTTILLTRLKENIQYSLITIHTPQGQGEQETPLEYWTSVGKANDVAFLIIPQIMEWKEFGYVRDMYSPPKVVIEYYLLDVEKKMIVERSRYYDEYMHTEYDLRYNTPPNGMFFSKRPSRMELAIDSIYKMMMDFGFIRNRKEKNVFAQ